MNYLPMKDLEKVREVSRLWNEEGCKILRKKRIIELHDMESLSRYISRFSDTNDFPHSIYQLWMDDITDNDPKMKKVILKFRIHFFLIISVSFVMMNL